MSVLIPILSKKENEKNFLEKATENEKEIFVMAIVEPKAFELDFGFTAKEISHANALMEEIKKNLEAQGKKVTDVLEWGETLHKINNFAKLKKTKKICLKKQENPSFKKLAKELKEQHNKVEII